MKDCKPFLKWIGGKTQIIEELLKEFPKEINNYHEIFLGGGSVLFALLQSDIKIYNNIYVYDINKELINTYINIKNNPEELIKSINILKNEYNSCINFLGTKKPKSKQESLNSKESYYYWIRNEYNKLLKENNDNILISAMFIFLNKTCFRGLYRLGPNGFNSPFGHYKNVKIIDEKNIYNISKLIKNVNFINTTFEESLKNINKDDFVYMDPPYYPINSTSFVKYNKCGFDLEKHKNLFKICNNLNNKFIMNNSNTEFVYNFFNNKKYEIKIINCKRKINSKNPNQKIDELMIKNYKSSYID